MAETSKKSPSEGSRTFSQEGLAGRPDSVPGAESEVGPLASWMFNKFPVYRTRENSDRQYSRSRSRFIRRRMRLRA